MEKILFWRVTITCIIGIFFINGLFNSFILRSLNILDFALIIISEIIILMLTWNIRLYPRVINKNNFKKRALPFFILITFFLWCQTNLAYVVGLFMDNAPDRIIYLIFSCINFVLLLISVLLMPKINFKKLIYKKSTENKIHTKEMKHLFF